MHKVIQIITQCLYLIAVIVFSTTICSSTTPLSIAPIENTPMNEDCPLGDVNLFSQEEVDQFLIDYPNCTEISGNLYISFYAVSTDLSPLSNIQTVGGDLIIRYSGFTSIEGLEGLTSIAGNLDIRYNTELTSIKGLEGLTFIGEEIYIQSNRYLSICNIEWLCNNIGNPDINFNIGFNTAGCDNIDEVNNSCQPDLEAVCQDINVTLLPGGQVGISASDVDGGSIDAFSGSVSPSTFNCDNLGENDVILTIMDDNGNSDDCTAIVTVEDGVGIADGWSTFDIGTATLDNEYNFEVCNGDQDQFIITGSGNNAFSTNTDNVAFASQTLCGDLTITAKIESTSSGGYGGLMIRESTDEDSKQVGIFSNQSNSLRHETRYFTGSNKVVQNFIKPAPYWLRLQRQGNNVFAFYSTNGVSFQYVHVVYVPLDDCVEIGLASFTYLANTLAETIFSNVEVEGTPIIQHIQVPVATELSSNQLAPSVYPNPVKDRLSLVFDTVIKNKTVLLRNNLGQIIEKRQLQMGDEYTEWDVSSLSNGIYFIESIEEGQQTQMIRFVKTN